MTHNLLVLRFEVLFFLILNPVKNIKEAVVAGVVVAVIFVFLINKKLRQALFKYSLFH